MCSLIKIINTMTSNYNTNYIVIIKMAAKLFIRIKYIIGKVLFTVDDDYDKKAPYLNYLKLKEQIPKLPKPQIYLPPQFTIFNKPYTPPRITGFECIANSHTKPPFKQYSFMDTEPFEKYEKSVIGDSDYLINIL